MIRLYFAYGANLNVENMEYRCPKAKPICTMNLPEWRLVFRNVADIEPAKGQSVSGLLWTITDDCEKALDIFEGYPHLYRKEYFMIKLQGKMKEDFGDTAEVMFYAMNRKGYQDPALPYFDCIKEGYEQNGMHLKPLKEALEHSWENATKMFQWTSKQWG